jgi:hypothetical protein
MSQNNGQTWVEVNGFSGIFNHPTLANVLYATDHGKIYKSIDSASTWTLITDKFKVANKLYAPYLGMDSSGKLYVKTYSESHVRNLADNTWQTTDFVPVSHPSNPSIIYRLDNTGKLYQSMNNGMAWSLVGDTGIGDSEETLIKINPTTPNVFYAVVAADCGLFGCASSKVYVSQDSGRTWTFQSKQNLISRWISDPNNAATLYANLESQFIKSTDYGKTWATRQSTDDVLPGTNVSWFEVNDVLATANGWFAATAQGIFKSTNNGQSWQAFSSGLPIVEPAIQTPMAVKRLATAPNEPGVLYAATERGLFVFGKNSPPSVNSVEVQGSAVTGSPVKLAVYGNYLDLHPLTLSLQDCANPTILAGGDDMSQYFQCQLGTTAGAKAGTVKDGNGVVLNSFSVQAVPPGPTVSSVTPKNTPIVGQTVTFALAGEYLPQSLRFNLPECLNPQEVAGGTATLRQYTCLVGGVAGNRNGTIKDANGVTLYQFNVAVIEPKVTEVTPLTVIAGERVEFTLHGQGLPDNLVFWIGYCADTEYLGGDASARRFRCTVGDLVGSEQEGRVLNARAENIFPFTVKITDTPPLASQCAVYNPVATPHVSIPCVKVGDEVYRAGMNIVPAPGLRFAVDMELLTPITDAAGESCAVFPHNGGLRINCVEVEGVAFWAELGLVPDAPGVQFDLIGADAK